MENDLPETLKKQIALIEGSLNKNSIKYNKYKSIIKKTETREETYEKIRMKYGKTDEKTDELSEKCSQIMENLKNDLSQSLGVMKLMISKNNAQAQINLLAQNASKYYFQIGKIMNEYGLISILVERNDKNFNRLELPKLKIDEKRAMKEFDISTNLRTSYGAIIAKILFQTNKIAKFIQDIQFGTMLNSDRINYKEDLHKNKNERIQLLSNLKTHYLKKVIKEEMTMDEEELKAFRENGLAKSEFFRLFEGEFENLDYEEELKKVEKYENRIQKVYAKKAELTEFLLVFLLSVNTRKEIGGDIRNLGIRKDENGELVLGTNINDYIMPLMVHIPNSIFQRTIEREINHKKEKKGYNRTFKVEKYKELREEQGKVFSTNLLYKLDKSQMDYIRDMAKKNKDNQIIRFFADQITRNKVPERDMVDAEEFLK